MWSMKIRKGLLVLAFVAALNVTLWLATTGWALNPGNLVGLVGPKMVRAEIVVQDAGVTHDYRVDRGRVSGVAGSSLTLVERDGTTATIQVAPGARITLDGRSVPLAALARRRIEATAVRDGDAPAQSVQARTR